MLTKRLTKTTTLPLLLTCSVGILLTGCGEEEVAPVVQAAAPQAPPPPPPPSLTPISDLMAQYNIDQRVVLEERFAPDTTDAARVAVLQFFDSFARADAGGLRTVMHPQDQEELDVLTSDDRFDDAVADIEEIEVRCGFTPNGDEAVVAILKMTDSYQPQLWEFMADEVSAPEFTSGPSPIDVMDNLSGDNWVSAWYRLLDQELAIAMELDEEVEVPQRDLTNDEGSPSTGSGGRSPSGPGRGRTPGRGPKIDPPSHDPSMPGG